MHYSFVARKEELAWLEPQQSLGLAENTIIYIGSHARDRKN
jgi:hypothetical protein